MLYQADLEDGDWRSVPWLIEQLGPHGGRLRRPPVLRQHMRDLERQLEGTRFGVETDKSLGYRLSALPLAVHSLAMRPLKATPLRPPAGNDSPAALLALVRSVLRDRGRPGAGSLYESLVLSSLLRLGMLLRDQPEALSSLLSCCLRPRDEPQLIAEVLRLVQRIDR